MPDALPPPPPAIVERCDAGLYLEPSVMVGIASTTSVATGAVTPHNVGSVLGRFAGGVLIRTCHADGSATHIRIGATFFVTNTRFNSGVTGASTGFGLETAVDRPIAPELRLGGRLGIESVAHDNEVFTVGARLHYRDLAYVGVDTYVLPPRRNAPRCTDYDVPGCGASTIGLMAGLGIEGTGGKALVVVAAVATIAGVAILAAGLGAVH